jgi:hypothetical protein
LTTRAWLDLAVVGVCVTALVAAALIDSTWRQAVLVAVAAACLVALYRTSAERSD